jgi:uncharacterized damage-inducible protein DinB
MKQYLLHFLEYNRTANSRLLQTILQLPQPGEAMGLFSHLIHAQDKWYNRHSKALADDRYSWQGPVFEAEVLEGEWERSTAQWISLLEASNENDLQQDVIFTRPSDGVRMAVSLGDVVMQLNCHAVHHRAQINKMISAQGLPVPPTDYIFTVLREYHEG